MEKNVRCKDHTDEPVRYYCTRCDSCVCVLCTFNQHHEHEIVEFEEAVESCKVRIEHLVEMCKEKMATIDDRVESMSKCETMMEELKRRIQEAASAYVEEVRTGETNLLEELRNIYGKECFGRIEGKENLATMVRKHQKHVRHFRDHSGKEEFGNPALEEGRGGEADQHECG